MPRERIYQAVTERLTILDPEGRVDAELMPDLTPEQLVELYRDMVTARAFDDKALKMQRQGRMGTWASTRGQEAIGAGVGLAMAPEDWLVPAFREHGIMLKRGVPGHLLYTYWSGDERGSCFPEGVRCFPVAIPVGSQWPHAVGIGWSLRLRGEQGAAVGFGGDGSTSQGDFHEALNFAAVFKVPVLFVVQNNHWAISVPVSRQTASASLAQKAHAYGMPGMQVDGNDVLAVYAAATEALARARQGEGPTLLEALTYRMGDHTTADDAGRYRPQEEVQSWLERDPIARLRRLLSAEHGWSEEREAALEAEVQGWVAEQVRLYEETAPAPPEELFRHQYAEMPVNLREQMDSLLAEVRR